MVYKKIKIILFPLMYLLLSINVLTADEPSRFRLLGETGMDKVRLYWETSDWPEDLYGFNVKRLDLDNKNNIDWVSLNSVPISPSITEHKNWNNLGIDDEDAERIKNKFKNYIKKNKIQSIENREMLEILKTHGGLKAGDFFQMRMDYDRVLMSNFGFVDNTYENGRSYIYGIFYVDESGIEKPEPVDVYQSIFIDKKGSDFDLYIEISQLKAGVKLTWKIEKEKVDLFGIFGCNIYRKNIKDKKFESIVTNPMGSYKVAERYMWWSYNDIKIDNSDDYIYAISPVNMFQTEYKMSMQKYTADDFKPLIPTQIDELKLTDETNINLAWKFNPENSGRVKGFFIERSDTEATEYENISGFLSPMFNMYVDKKQKQAGKIYLYRLVTVDYNGKHWYSKIKSIQYIEYVKPPAVEKLEALFLQKSDGGFIKLSWNSKTEDDDVTKGWVIESDGLKIGQMLRLASIGLVTKNEYLHKIYDKGGRLYKFRVIPLSHKGVEGIPVEVSTYVPLLKYPPVIKFNAVWLQDNQNVQLNWEYPILQDFLGFQIFMNGGKIAGTEDVGKNVRGWIVPEPVVDKDNFCRFQIQAVGQVAFSGKGFEKSVFIPNKRNANNVKQPKDFVVELVINNENNYAKLSWKKDDLKESGILGYILYADYVTEGSVMRLLSLPLVEGNQYLYKLPVQKRKKFTFRIAGMTLDREITPYVEAILNIPEQSNLSDE